MIRALTGDCREVLKTLPDESVHCIVTSPREASGRFRKGVHAYRAPQPHWDRDWLVREYVEKARSTGDIAHDIGCTDENVLFWLKKHGIPRRNVSQARSVKRWGASGASNPMFGKTGALNPRYVDGSAPERQTLYARHDWKAFLAAIYRRDGFCCVRCGKAKAGPRSLHAHHIQPWAGNAALRFDEENVVTLCRTCHEWVHSRANVGREYLR
jgi:5-methylcytosine-specific restriction protein A